MTNDAQRKRLIAAAFDRAADTYDSVAGSYFSYFGPRSVARANIPNGGVVLDVACGKGAALIPAAQLGVATAVGVDISLEMARSARARAAERDLGNVCVAVMDGDGLALRDDCVDAAICGFSMHFFADPVSVVSEFARVVRPGGTVVLSEWGREDDRWSWESDLIRKLGVHGVTTGSFDQEDMASVLAKVGLRDVRIEEEELDVLLADENEWWTWKWSYSFRHVLEQLEEATLQRFKDEAFSRLRDMRVGAGLPLTLSAIFAAGRTVD